MEVIVEEYFDDRWPLMMASRTADPKAPPMARKEMARPVAVEM